MIRRLQRFRELELTCPHCGHLQQEPSRVISSFCRSCGEHFRVLKGIAIANPGLKVSGIAEVRPESKNSSPAYRPSDLPEEVSAEAEAWLVDAEDGTLSARGLTRPDDGAEDEPEGISAGAFFGLAQPEDLSDSEDVGDGFPAIGGRAKGRSALSEGSMGALIGGQRPFFAPEKEKMPPNYVAPDQRKRRDENVPEIPVRCFRCYRVQDVSRFAKSTQCERCSAYISLANYDIRTVKSHTLRTRGDLTIGRRGGLVKNSEIACRNLTVNGAIHARVDCSGEAVFRHSGEVLGQLYCARLVIEKNCEVRFPDGVMTERAEINGHLIGDLTCSGKVRIGRAGVVEGDLTAADLEAKEGGRVVGKTRIDPGTTTDLPLKKGFNPTIIA